MSLILTLLLGLSSLTYANTKIFSDDVGWANCPMILGDVSGFLRRYSDIGVDPSGSSLCTELDKKLKPSDWVAAIKSNHAPLVHKKFKNEHFNQVKSYTELSTQFQKFGGRFEPNVKPVINKFLNMKSENPVIFYVTKGDEMLIFIGTSDGKYASFSTDLFKKKNK